MTGTAREGRGSDGGHSTQNRLHGQPLPSREDQETKKRHCFGRPCHTPQRCQRRRKGFSFVSLLSSLLLFFLNLFSTFMNLSISLLSLLFPSQLWMVLFSSSEVLLLQLSEDLSAELNSKLISSRGSLTKRSASKIGLFTSLFEEVNIVCHSLYERLSSPRVAFKNNIKEEVELLEITSIGFQSENVLAVGTTRKQLATYYFGFADEEEAMEWLFAIHSLRSKIISFDFFLS